MSVVSDRRISVAPAANASGTPSVPRRTEVNDLKAQRTAPWRSRHAMIAAFAAAAIALHLFLRFGTHCPERVYRAPLLAALLFGGLPLVFELTAKLFRLRLGSDLLAGISIVVSVLLGQYLAGAFVVLMLSGGETLEAMAVGRASSALGALARRMPTVVHRVEEGRTVEVPIERVAVGDTLRIFPHETCPVDAQVTEGHGTMDESFLTGEPFRVSKAPGADVLSGAINGDQALTVVATRRARDSRYARIMEVVRESERHPPQMRRLADQLGAWYTPVAIGIAAAAWAGSGQVIRFLAVLVIATPCPLLIAVPVAILGGVSLCARRGIVVRKPAVLERIRSCTTVIFDKTGTLTYGEPVLTEFLAGPGFQRREVLAIIAGVERYSRHPLASAVLKAARAEELDLPEADHVTEPPGQGLRGEVRGHSVLITGRRHLATAMPEVATHLPASGEGLECVAVIDGRYAATLRFRDAPRTEGRWFVDHLRPQHHFDKLMILSGDRESEVAYLAEHLGIPIFRGSMSPEQKLDVVRRESAAAPTLYLGDGINDAPALSAATVGVVIGQSSDVTNDAAGAVVLNTSLERVDEFLHIGARMRRIALQSAIAGMALSLVGMVLAAGGLLSPLAGAVIQEVIDVAAVTNALRAGILPRRLSDRSNT